MSSDGVTAARTLLDSMMAGDGAGVMSVLHPDLVVRAAPSLWYGGDHHGPTAFAEAMGVIAERVDAKVTDYQVYDCDEVTVVNMRATFTAKATGRSMEMPITEIYRVRDGRIVDMDVYYKDTAALLALLTG